MPIVVDKHQVKVNERKLTCSKCKKPITDTVALKVRKADAIEVKDPEDPKKKKLHKSGEWKREYQHTGEC